MCEARSLGVLGGVILVGSCWCYSFGRFVGRRGILRLMFEGVLGWLCRLGRLCGCRVGCVGVVVGGG